MASLIDYWLIDMSLADEDSSLKVVDIVAADVVARVEESFDVGLGTVDRTKTDECSEKFQRGGGHFQYKNLYRRFGIEFT